MARHKISQAELAKALDKTQQALSRRISGETPFKVDELHTVADVLGVPVGRLMNETAA